MDSTIDGSRDWQIIAEKVSWREPSQESGGMMRIHLWVSVEQTERQRDQTGMNSWQTEPLVRLLVYILINTSWSQSSLPTQYIDLSHTTYTQQHDCTSFQLDEYGFTMDTCLLSLTHSVTQNHHQQTFLRPAPPDLPTPLSAHVTPPCTDVLPPQGLLPHFTVVFTQCKLSITLPQCITTSRFFNFYFTLLRQLISLHTLHQTTSKSLQLLVIPLRQWRGYWRSPDRTV